MTPGRLPYDLLFLIVENTQGYEYLDTVRVLRLTSRWLNAVATVALFRSLRLFAHDPRSWTKMKKIQHESRLGQHARILTIYRHDHTRCDIHDRLDLASMSNLEKIVIAGVSVMHFQRRGGPVENPDRPEPHDTILPLDRICDHEEDRWFGFFSDLIKVARAYGFELDLLLVYRMESEDWPSWIRILPTLDLRHLRTLVLRADFCTNDDLVASIILPALRDLPSLVHLRIDQDRKKPGSCDLISLFQDYHWPSLRYLQIVTPITSCATFREFLFLYRGQLRRLALNGVCPEMTMVDLRKECVELTGVKADPRYGKNTVEWDRNCGPVLHAWIKQKIIPDRFTIDSYEPTYHWKRVLQESAK